MMHSESPKRAGSPARTPLAEFLQSRGQSVADFARQSGLGYYHLTRVCSGLVKPSPELAARIAAALQVPCSIVFPDVATRPTSAILDTIQTR